MSQHNVHVVLGMVAAYNTGDVEATMRFFAPDVEALPDASAFPEASPLRGRDEFRRWVVQAASAWVDVGWKTLQTRDVGGNRVLDRGEWGGRGRASGVETYSGITGLYTIRDGVIRRAEWFFDHSKALAAAGLEE